MTSFTQSYQIIKHIDLLYRAFVAPIVAVIGIVGNILIFAVIIRWKILRFEWYCIILSLANLFAVIFNTLIDDFLGRGMEYLSNGRFTFQPNTWSTASCRFLELVPTMMYFSSAYIMIVFTLDRCLVMSFPFKFTPKSHQRQAVCLSGLVLLMSCIISIPLAMSHTKVENSTYRAVTQVSCEVTNTNLSIISLYMKSLIIFVIPTILIIFLNAIIVSKLIGLKKYQQNTSIPPVSVPEMNRIFGHMALSISFLFLTLPLSVTILLRLTLNKGSINNDPESILTHTSKLFSAVKDLTYCCNIFLYLIFLPRFRRHLCLLLKCKFDEIRFLSKTNDSKVYEKFNKRKNNKVSRSERLMNTL